MAIYSVDSDRVGLSAAQVAATSERIRAEVATMMSDLLDLQASWTGLGHTAFTQTITQWQATQVQVEAALDAIAVQMTAAAQTYQEAEIRTMALMTG